MNALKWLLIRSQENALIGLLILVGSIAGANDILALILPHNIGVYLIALIFAAIIIAQLLTDAKIKSLDPLPSKSDTGLFHPFMTGLNQVWPRERETQRLARQITDAVHSHLIVTGPSGAGKSVLVSKLVHPLLESKFCIQEYRRYDNILQNIISDLDASPDSMVAQARLLSRYEQFIHTERCSVRELLQPDFCIGNLKTEHLWREIETYLDSVFLMKQFCFVFDQAERYITMISSELEKDTHNLNGYDAYFFREFVRFCRRREGCRSVFIIRAEYLYDSLDFLETISGAADETTTKPISYFLCPGINTVSAADGVAQIRASFKKISVAAEHFQKFERVSGLESRTYSNTFMTQLFGLLIERFYSSDQEVKSMLVDERDRYLALRIFFDHLLNDYRRLTRSQDALEILKSVLFTIAIENRLTGQSIGRQRIAALAHIPAEIVDDVIPFLLNIGILLTEDTQQNEISYRLVHDIISDYVIESGQLAIDPLLKEEVRGLSEARARIPTTIDRYANLITDWGSRVNVGLVAIWLFFILGALKFHAGVCEYLSPVFERYVWQAEDCRSVIRYYLPIYFMHVVWLTFIYHMDRDYLRYTLKSRSLRFISGAMPVVGATLAIILSQSPSLFVLPVVCGGLMMGGVLCYGALTKEYVGRAARRNLRWGVLTFVNMLLASILTVVAWLVLWRDATALSFWNRVAELLSTSASPIPVSREIITLVLMYALNIIMIYFWIQIRRSQQNRIAFAALLAQYDRTFTEQK